MEKSNGKREADFWRKEAWDALNNKVESIEKKVDDLLTWKNKMIGASVVISALVSLVANYIYKKF